MATVDRSLWQKIIHEVVTNGGNIIRPWFTQLQPISLEHGLLEIDVPAEGQSEPYTISLNRGVELVARILDPEGKPVKHFNAEKLLADCL